MHSLIFILVLCLPILTGCFRDEGLSTLTAIDLNLTQTPLPPDFTPPPTPAITPTSIYPWADAAGVMSGICFEAAYDAAGQVFIIRDAAEHIRFYDLADNSALCRRPVTRQSFDFSAGRMLVGLWSKGTGCSAHHDVLMVTRDESTNTLYIDLRLVTEGDCPYELLRPFWIAVEDELAVEIRVE